MMGTGQVCVVVGATGDVGRGVTAQLLGSGARVVAIGRHADKLDRLREEMQPLGPLEILTGSLADPDSAADLLRRLGNRHPRLDAVIVSVNGPSSTAPLATQDVDGFAEMFRTNVLSHLIGLQTFVPAIRSGGMYVAIGGGMADWIFPGAGMTSACQAAQRAMVRSFAAENEEKAGIRIRELMLHSMIAGRSKRDVAQPNWITDDDVGRHVLTMLTHPEAFPDVVVNLKSRKQVGQIPQAAPQPSTPVAPVSETNERTTS